MLNYTPTPISNLLLCLMFFLLMFIIIITPISSIEMTLTILPDDYINGVFINSMNYSNLFDPNLKGTEQTQLIESFPGDVFKVLIKNANQGNLNFGYKLSTPKITWTSDNSPVRDLWTMNVTGKTPYKGNKIGISDGSDSEVIIFTSRIPFIGTCKTDIVYLSTVNLIVSINKLFTPLLVYNGWEGSFPLIITASTLIGRLKTKENTLIELNQEYTTEELQVDYSSTVTQGTLSFSAYDSDNNKIQCPGTIHFCYKTCAECSSQGDSTLHNCISCIQGFTLTSNKICITTDCPMKWYMNSITNTKECLTACNAEFPKEIYSNHQCIKGNLEDEGVIRELWEYKDIFYTTIELMDYIKMTNVTEGLINWNWRKKLKEIKEIITINDREDDDLIEFMYDLHSKINGDQDYTISLFQANSNDRDSNKVRLGECELKLKTHYNIPKNKPLFIVLYDVIIANGTQKEVEYWVYDNIFNRLDLFPCKDMKITIESPLPPKTPIDLKTIADMALKGIDLFDSTDPFFNDICFPFKDNNNLDINIKDRRKELYQNSSVTLCNEGCSFTNIDMIQQTYVCECLIKDIENLKPSVTKDETSKNTDEFLSPIPMSNLKIVTCYMLWAKFDNLKLNIAFWIIIALLILYSLCFTKLICHGLKRIYDKLNKDPDRWKRRKMTQTLLKDNNNSNNSRRSAKSNSQSVKNNTIIKKTVQISPVKAKSKFKMQSTTQLRPIPIAIPRPNPTFKLQASNKTTSMQNLPIIIYPQNNLAPKNSSSTSYNSLSCNSNSNKNLGITAHEIVNHSSSKALTPSIDLFLIKRPLDNYIPFKTAIDIDKRNPFRIYWSITKDTQIFIQPFTSQTPYDMSSLKLSILILNLTLSLTINTLFYQDDLVSKKYYSQGNLLMLSSFLKSLYVFLLNGLFLAIILCPTKYQGRFELIVYEYQRPKHYHRLLKKEIRRVKKRLICFYLMGLVVMLWSLYYCTIFCIVYNGNMMSLIVDEGISLGIACAVNLTGAIACSVMRFCSIKWQKRYLYYTSLYLIRFI